MQENQLVQMWQALAQNYNTVHVDSVLPISKTKITYNTESHDCQYKKMILTSDSRKDEEDFSFPIAFWRVRLDCPDLLFVILRSI